MSNLVNYQSAILLYILPMAFVIVNMVLIIGTNNGILPNLVPLALLDILVFGAMVELEQ